MALADPIVCLQECSDSAKKEINLKGEDGEED